MILTLDDLFTVGELRAINNFLDKSPFKYGWKSNKNLGFAHWNFDITRTAPDNPTDVRRRLPEHIGEFWDRINKNFFEDEAVVTRCYANRHTFGTEGYIHTDTERAEDYTVVIYMNEVWNMNWGGETAFYNLKNSEIIQSVAPHFGRVAVFQGKTPHCARSVSRICPEARTTLMFKCSVNPSVMYTSEKLLMEFLDKAGTKAMPHKNGSLYDHLMRVYHLLKFKTNDTIAVAGGLHSIYGTNAYQNKTLPYYSTLVEETFGKEVDHLVRLFCSINRPAVLENPDGSLTHNDLVALQAIECANLYDQNELDRFPNLSFFAKGYK